MEAELTDDLPANFNTSELLHPHWLVYYHDGTLPPPRWIYQLIMAIMVVVGSVTLVGNTILVCTFGCRTGLQSPSNLLVAGMSVAELGLAFVTFPFIAANAYVGHWLFGKNGCLALAHLLEAFMFSSVTTMAVIAVDRCLSLRGVRFWHLDRRRAIVLNLASWIYGFSLAGVSFVAGYILSPIQTDCTADYLTHTLSNRIAIIVQFMFGFVVPLFVIVVCYLSILHYLLTHKAQMRRLAIRHRNLVPPGHGLLSSDNELQAIITCMLIVLAFCSTRLPYAILAMASVMQSTGTFTPILVQSLNLWAKTSGCFTPIIYALMSRRFRQAVCRRSSAPEPVADVSEMRLLRVTRETLTNPIDATQGQKHRLSEPNVKPQRFSHDSRSCHSA